MIYLLERERKLNMTKKEDNNKKPQQDPIQLEDLSTYLTYTATKTFKDLEHAQQIKDISRRTVTMADVTTVTRVLLKEHENIIENLIGIVQVQERVLLKIGATEETFKEAEKEYVTELEEVRKKLEKEQKEREKEQEEGNKGDEEISE